MADEALAGMNKVLTASMPQLAGLRFLPEKLLKAQLLMILYEQIHYNFLVRWFLSMSLEEKVWDHSSFLTNQERLIGSDIAAEFSSPYPS